MKLNELNEDGLLTWIQVVYGPCKGCRCHIGTLTGSNSYAMLCPNHETYDCIKTLLHHGIYLNLEYELRWAAAAGKLDVVTLLIEEGANVSFRNNWALKYAIEYNHTKIIALLEKHKINET